MRLLWRQGRTTANTRGPGKTTRVWEAGLPAVRGRWCSREGRWGTRTIERWGVLAGGNTAGDGRRGTRTIERREVLAGGTTAGDGRRGTGSVSAVRRHCTGNRRRGALTIHPRAWPTHRIERRGPGAREDSLLWCTDRCAAVRRRSTVDVGAMFRWRIGGV